MRRLEYGETLQVGDVIKTKHAFGGSEFKVTRVTKRFAFCARESDGYEHKFKSVALSDMAVPSQRWNMVGYSVYRGEK